MPNIEHRSRKKRRSNYFAQVRFCLLIFICFLFTSNVLAQNYLTQLISIDVKDEKLSDVLERISKVGNFYFSYSSSVIPKDSLISISVKETSIEEVLNKLLKGDYEYKEAPNYVILRLAPNRLQLVSEDNLEFDQIHTITGYVVDDLTGAKLPNASIYEKSLLLSTLTDENGYFKLKVKNPVNSLSLTISKEYYRDTTIVLLAPVLIKPGNNKNERYGYQPGDDLLKVERTAMGRFFVSSKQKLQSLNLGSFFAYTPFQTSITPGLSTHGSLSGQVINKFSINVLGGYTSGVNGVELGGGFNINKRNVNFLQVAGVFNLVGGSVNGVQLAGANNSVLDSINGIQVAGIYNKVQGSVHGVQMAGGINIAKKEVYGLQMAGLGNVSHIKTEGVQLSGLFNYSRNLRGLQIGFINVADTSSGVSIGVFNYIKGGYKNLILSNTEFNNVNVGFKTGNAAFYTVLMGGGNFTQNQKAFTFGIGFGHDFIFNDRFFLSAELSSQNVYLGSWKELSNLYRTKALLNLNISKRFGVFSGPALNLFIDDRTATVKGYKDAFPLTSYQGKHFTSNTNGWIGWEFGITLF